MDALGRRCLKCQPSSRTGENPPYGMIGGIVETSASFEARYAPRSYPTAGGSAMVVPTATVGPDCPFKMALIFFRLVGLFPRFAFDVHEFAMQIGART